MAVSTKPPSPGGVPEPPAGRAGQAPEAAPGVAIDVVDAGKQFDDKWVVRHLTFQVDRGTIFGLFGPSGSGKTTAIRLMLGLLRLDEGRISVLGTSPGHFRSRLRARIGYMPQLFVLYPELSVLENLNLAASLYGLGWLKRRKPMRRVLEFVELWDHRKKTTDQLSGGMKRRLQLATALVHEPDLLVVDEPTAGIDPILRAKFWDHFRALRDEGRTIFVTSQYVTEAEYCDRIAVLGRGELVAVGTPEGIRDEAMGGEIVDVRADRLDRQTIENLRGLPGVRGVQALSYDQLRLTVDEAGAAIPQIMTALAEAGADVTQVQEYRPNFDEVFVKLMEQSDVASVE